jgi:hypothetical protein
MRRHVAAFTGIVVLGLALIGAGCGGDDAPSKSDYLADANEICKSSEEELDKAGDEYFQGLDIPQGGEPSQEQITQFVEEEAVPALESLIADLRDLTPPEGDEDTVEAIYDAADEGIAEVREDPSAFTGDEQPASFQEADRLARDYGLDQCAG